MYAANDGGLTLKTLFIMTSFQDLTTEQQNSLKNRYNLGSDMTHIFQDEFNRAIEKKDGNTLYLSVRKSSLICGGFHSI